ncbi:retrovirus-related Pol polyprotein from transposon opus [Trichinella spiralis]|uniref:retrovirus-related Pol polyprotein from transposon opus n=1 Tax=Trichinella spiralis TaxID=6334 RepID=UPI0001EFDFF2|nr:retrovirus-related Pol polyprotein from transposon opus [Trichinella spiralis]
MLDVARVAANKRLVLTSTSQHRKSNRKPNSVAPSAVKPKSEILDSAMNYARRRALQSTCPTSVMAASAFDALKYHLTSTPILAYPEFNCQFTVDVDVRGDGLGAVLSQRKGKTERVVAFAFRTLTKAERQYCTTQKEMLSLVWGLQYQGPVGGHPAGRPTDLTSAAVVGWRELASRMSPRVQSRHARAVAQRRSWADADGFIWRHSRGLTAEEGAKQMLLP